MSNKMKAYRLLEWGQPPQVVEVDIPKPGPGQILVKVAGNGPLSFGYRNGFAA